MASYSKQTGKSIQESFEDFHASNPDIFNQIVFQVERAVTGGKEKLSIKQIIGWIRWEVYVKTKEPTLFETGETFKINDAYTSRYSRLLIEQYPAYEKYIETRQLRS